VDKENKTISLVRQSEMLGISRSSLYYQPTPISEKDKQIMDLIDRIYTDCPYYGNRRIKWELNKTYGLRIGRDHARTLMNIMGLQALYPKPNTSKPGKNHKIYPYLLRGVKIIKPNQVWSADITYVRLLTGWAYLIAIIDWFSRYVINWQLSNTLEIDFCLDCLNRALDDNKIKPSVFNSDQGSQFTSVQFTDILNQNRINISMDGRGRCLDNIFVERLWRTVKQENIYLNDYQNILETKNGLNQYFTFYNNQRRHQSLNYETPAQIYYN
jgi:putative transposase